MPPHNVHVYVFKHTEQRHVEFVICWFSPPPQFKASFSNSAIKVATWSKTRFPPPNSNTGIVGLNPSLLKMYVCCVFMLPCVGSAYWQGWSPVGGFLPTVYKSNSSILILMENRPESLILKVVEEAMYSNSSGSLAFTIVSGHVFVTFQSATKLWTWGLITECQWSRCSCGHQRMSPLWRRCFRFLPCFLICEFRWLNLAEQSFLSEGVSGLATATSRVSTLIRWLNDSLLWEAPCVIIVLVLFLQQVDMLCYLVTLLVIDQEVFSNIQSK
jgi:hypothetical protein